MKNLLTIISSCFVAAAVIFSLGSCEALRKAADKKRERNAEAFFDQHPDKAAVYFVKKFPRDTTIIRIVIDSTHRADNKDFSALIDSLYKAMDSLNVEWLIVVDSTTSEVQRIFQRELSRTQRKLTDAKKIVDSLKHQYKPCLPDTVFKTTEINVSDPARDKALIKISADYVALEKKSGDAEKQLKVRFWMLIAAAAIILLLLVLLFRRRK